MKLLCKICLKEVLVMQKGIKPSILAKSKFDGSVPYLDISALETGVIREYTFRELGNLSNENDVLIVWDGGRSGLCFRGQEGAVGSTIMRLTPIGFLPSYIFYFIKSKFEYINKNSKGNSIPHVDPEIFYELEVPYLTYEDQAQIVLKIENKLQHKSSLLKLQQNSILKSLANSSIKYEHDVDFIQNFDNFKQAVLLNAFSGKLSAKFRKDSSKAQINIKTKADYEPYLNEFDIPIDWHWDNLKNISQLAVGSTPKRGIKAYWNGTIPWLSSGELNNSYIVDSKEKVTQIGAAASNLKILKENTILMAMVGEGKTRGKVALLKIPASTNQNVCSITLDENINAKFVFYYFHLRYKEIRNGSVNARSSSSQSALNSTIIGKFNICLPSYKEQCHIAERVDKIFTTVDKLTSEFSVGLDDLVKLEQSILTEAFLFDQPTSNKQSAELAKLINFISSEKLKIEENRSEIRKVQVKFKKEHFMKNTTDNIISELKKNASKLFGKKNISSEDKIILFENLQTVIPDMDFDDFSVAFQELAQEKLYENEEEPFFISKNISGKLYHTINS